MGTAETNEHWRLGAACRGMATEMFFPRGNSDITRYDEDRAKAVCAICAVRVECLAYAQDSDQPCGIWGGLSTEERRMLRRVEG